MARRPRVFLDASVFFSAVYSPGGSARRLILRALQGDVLLVVSPQVLAETERNLASKAPEVLADYRRFLEAIGFQVTRTPSRAKVRIWVGRIHAKDAPILAAAIAARVDYLTTWNTKHFLRDPELAEEAGVVILTPDDLMARLESGR